MASVPQGPALPWAAADSSKGVSSKSKQTATEITPSDLHPVAIDQLGLQIGDRIEVMWTLEPDPPAEPYQRWWGASVISPDAQQDPPTVSGSNGPYYKLRYDPAPADGFNEEEVVPVQLLTHHTLYDCDRSDVMCWRREGDSYEPPDESEGQQDSDGMIEDVQDDDEATGGTVSLQQLASGISEADVAAGEAEMLDSLAGELGPAGQMHMVAGYREFMDNFKAFIAAKASAQPDADGDLLITTADVEEFKAMMQTKKAQKKF